MEMQGPGMVTHSQGQPIISKEETSLAVEREPRWPKRDSTELGRGMSPVCKHRGDSKGRFKLKDREKMGEKMGKLG